MQSPLPSEAEGMEQAVNSFAGAVFSELFLKRDHPKPYKACMTEPESAVWPSSAVTGVFYASLEIYMQFFCPSS